MPWTTSTACPDGVAGNNGVFPTEDGYEKSNLPTASQLALLRFVGTTLELEDGSQVINGVGGSFWQSGSSLGAKGVVLGLESSKGRTSRIDCILGQVGQQGSDVL